MKEWNIPEGSDTPDAPWNRDDDEGQEVYETPSDWRTARDEARYDL